MITRSRLLALLALVGVAACSPSDCSRSAQAPGAGIQVPLRLEAYCGDVPDLQRPLRQTVILLDSFALQPAANATEYGAKNAHVRDLVRNLADPTQIAQGGASEPRERISIFLLPRDGGSPQLLFVGCPPGFSADETRRLEASQSALTRSAETFFGAGRAQRAAEAADEFQTRLLGALLYASNPARTSEPANPANTFAQSTVVRSLTGAAHVIDLEQGIPRIILLTDLSRFPLPASNEKDARSLGFADAAAAHIDLARSELHIAGTNGGPNSSLVQAYAQAFFLGSRARVASIDGNTLAPLPPAPVRVDVFSGQIDYGPYEFPIQARLAFDRNNTLVNSWIVVTREGEVATPLSGSATCDAGGACRITSDDSGFAQAWASDRREPQYGGAMPFGGLRYIELNLAGGQASGRVFDPVVARIGDLPDLRFELTRVQDGRL